MIAFINWSEIKDVKTIPRSNVMSWLSFISDYNHIDMELTKKMYNTIMKICPNTLVKIMINDIECFKCFH